MSERTAPLVLLAGDWPSASPGYSHFPSTAPVVWRLDPVAFRVYGYLVSLGYSQDGLSPLPERVGPALELPERETRAAYCTLISAGLLILVSGNGGPWEELHLPLPSSSE